MRALSRSGLLLMVHLLLLGLAARKGKGVTHGLIQKWVGYPLPLPLLISTSISISTSTSTMAISSISTKNVKKLGVFGASRGYSQYKAQRAGAVSLSSFNEGEGGGEGVRDGVITSTSNPKVKLVRSLSKKKKRDQLGLVVLEGFRHVLEAIDGGLRPTMILVTPDALNSEQGQYLLNAAYTNSLPLDVVATNVFNSHVSDTVTSQGVAATFDKPNTSSELSIDVNKRKESLPLLAVVMDRVADPGNVGTIVRTCFGLGVDAVINIEGGCDYWSPKVLRSSMGLCLSTRVMPLLQLDWTATHKWLIKTNINIQQHPNQNPNPSPSPSSSPSPNRERLQLLIADGSSSSLPHYQVDFSRPTVLVIGSEAFGVSDEAAQVEGEGEGDGEGGGSVGPVDIYRVKIPMERSLESFNAAVAGAIILAEAARQREGLGSGSGSGLGS